MSKEKAVLEDVSDLDGLDLDEIESRLEEEFENKISDLGSLDEQMEAIGNPEVLGDVLLNTVIEQFKNQVAIKAGEDFIEKYNNGQFLDLSDDAHIQTTENFAEGKIASHNTEIDYQKRYDDWMNNFQKKEDGTINTTIDSRTGEEKAVLRVKDKKKDPNGENYNKNYNAREFIDKDRPKGSKTVHKDHTISAAEIIRDPKAAAHMTRDEQAAFANSDVNLLDLDSRANQSKGDSKMTEWLDFERNGEKPADRYPINEDELRKRDEQARSEYEKQKRKAEDKSIVSGKKTKKAEALKVSKQAAKAIMMNLLADLVKEVIAKLILWLKSTEKSLKTLLTSIKNAIVSFVTNLKNNLVNVTDTALTVIATSIIGPIVSTVKRAWMFIKQGWSSLKQSVDYIKDPKNKEQPIGIMILEVGKIITAGLTAAGAIVLGEVIEDGLTTIPVLAVEIPLFGSLANIIGIFMGAMVSGIIGALAIHLINQIISKKQKAEKQAQRLDKGNEILKTQENLKNVTIAKTNQTKSSTAASIKKRHEEAADIMKKSLQKVKDNSHNFDAVDNSDDFDEIEYRLSKLLDD